MARFEKAINRDSKRFKSRANLPDSAFRREIELTIDSVVGTGANVDVYPALGDVFETRRKMGPMALGKPWHHDGKKAKK